jgi:chromosome segregation ATPase
MENTDIPNTIEIIKTVAWFAGPALGAMTYAIIWYWKRDRDSISQELQSLRQSYEAVSLKMKSQMNEVKEEIDRLVDLKTGLLDFQQQMTMNIDHIQQMVHNNQIGANDFQEKLKFQLEKYSDELRTKQKEINTTITTIFAGLSQNKSDISNHMKLFEKSREIFNAHEEKIKRVKEEIETVRTKLSDNLILVSQKNKK